MDIHSALYSLENDEMRFYQLKYFEDLDYYQIADEMDLTYKEVLELEARAEEELGIILNDHYDELNPKTKKDDWSLNARTRYYESKI